MDPEPSGLLALLQFLLLLLYALLTAAEGAAQQFILTRRRASQSEDERDDWYDISQRLTATPSGLRFFLQLIAFSSAALAFWCFALPLQKIARESWGWSFLSAGGMTALFTFVIFLLLTFIFQLLGVLLPRKIAAQKPRGTARLLFKLALAVFTLFRPMALALDRLSGFIIRLLRIEIMQPTEEITENEIRMLVDVGEEKGAIEEAERKMIENVFEFNNMTAEECMTHRTDMYAIWLEDTTQEIITLISETGLSRFPVYNEDLDDIIGTVSTREFLLNLQQGEPLPLRGIIREAHFVPESVRTDLLFRDMQRNKYHMAVVVDEYGGTSGLITMEDLLEEIVGNIYDEYDPLDLQEFETLSENRWRVSGTMEVRSFNEKTGLELPVDEEYDTIGGLILSQMTSIPEDGSAPEIDYLDLHFKVELVRDRRIEWVEVSVPDAV